MKMGESSDLNIIKSPRKKTLQGRWHAVPPLFGPQSPEDPLGVRDSRLITAISRRTLVSDCWLISHPHSRMCRLSIACRLTIRHSLFLVLDFFSHRFQFIVEYSTWIFIKKQEENWKKLNIFFFLNKLTFFQHSTRQVQQINRCFKMLPHQVIDSIFA